MNHVIVKKVAHGISMEDSKLALNDLLQPQLTFQQCLHGPV